MKTYSMTLSDLLSVVFTNVDDDASVMISSLANDSRQVEKGSVFFAYPGENSDGREYIQQAIDAGAAAVFCESEELDEKFSFDKNQAIPIIPFLGLRSSVGLLASHFYQQPSDELQVFGVTGTNGKTTCCYLLTQALTSLGLKAAMIGTTGTGYLSDLSYSGLTTPGPIEVQRLLAHWRDEACTQVCMEVSSHALDQGRVTGVNFYATLFTNLSHDHLDYHGDMAAYADAKERLFVDYASELAIINADDALGDRLINSANADFVVSYGDAGDVSIGELCLEATGMKILIETSGVDFEVNTRLIGKINTPNILLLIATLLALSVTVEDIQAIVSELKPAPGRMELYNQTSRAKVVVDFAHTPDALEKALQSVREHCTGELWCVFGCGGDRDRAKRPVMGEAASTYADKLIITNDNPRSEEPSLIVEDILAGVNNRELVSVEVILDRASAIQAAIERATAEDWVLVAGRGHEHLQQIGDQYIPFSDRAHVSQIMGLAA